MACKGGDHGIWKECSMFGAAATLKASSAWTKEDIEFRDDLEV